MADIGDEGREVVAGLWDLLLMMATEFVEPTRVTEPRGVVTADDACEALLNVAGCLKMAAEQRDGVLDPSLLASARVSLLVAHDYIRPVPSIVPDGGADQVTTILEAVVENLRTSVLKRQFLREQRPD